MNFKRFHDCNDDNNFLEQCGNVKIFVGSAATWWIACEAKRLIDEKIKNDADLANHSEACLREATINGCSIFALNSESKMVGFVYLKKFDYGREPFVSPAGLVSNVPGLGKCLKKWIHKLAERRHPDLNIVSISSNPAVQIWNEELGGEEIDYERVNEKYGHDVYDAVREASNSHLDDRPRLWGNPFRGDSKGWPRIIVESNGGVDRIYSFSSQSR